MNKSKLSKIMAFVVVLLLLALVVFSCLAMASHTCADCVDYFTLCSGVIFLTGLFMFGISILLLLFLPALRKVYLSWGEVLFSLIPSSLTLQKIRLNN